jgi:hypothetical protein
MIKDMKKYLNCFGMIALISSVMFFASCKDDEAPKSTACDIVSFSVDGAAWTVDGTNITRTYPAETVEAPLTPTITLSEGATVSPASGVEQNFFTDAGVTYTVTAEDGVTKKTYTAKATRTQYAGAEIVSFKVGDIAWTLIDDSVFYYAYPPDTEETTLTPTIVLSPGATVNPAASVAQNFFTEQGVKYTVTSEDGATTKNYYAKAKVLSASALILTFKIGDVDWTIDGANITHEYPRGTETGRLTPTITLSPGATVNPDSGVEQNFFTDAGVTYTVTAEDGVTTNTYTAKATVELSEECEILSFVVDNEEWGIFDTEIFKQYPAGTAVTSLIPTITLSEGATINPASGTEQNFFTEEGVTYTVTAENGVTTKSYTVKATVAEEVPNGPGYDKSNWTVLPRHGWHGWHYQNEEDPGGVGSQTLWEGGHPMLAIDDDPTSGWHSFVFGENSFPQGLVIDMKDYLDVVTVTGTGNYLRTIQFYVVDADVPFDGYYEHNVNWGEDYWRHEDYIGWVNNLKESIPDPDEWALKMGEVISADGTSFSFRSEYVGYGRYLIIKFPDNTLDNIDQPYVALYDLKVYDH